MKTKTTIGIIALSLFGYGLYSFLTSDSREPSCWAKSKFDKILWNSDLDSRFCMIDDIVKSKILINKSKNELFKLVGQPFTQSNFSDKEAFQFKTGVNHGPYGRNWTLSPF